MFNPHFNLKKASATERLPKLSARETEAEMLRAPLAMYLAGGMAVHLYTGSRATTDVDAEFSARVLLPTDLVVSVELENGEMENLYIDTNYNSTFALMHEDYQDDCVPVDIGGKFLAVKVLSPVDLAVSKLARFAHNDQEDIAALAKHGIFNAAQIEQRAESALVGYIGNQTMLRLNLRDALSIVRSAQSETDCAP